MLQKFKIIDSPLNFSAKLMTSVQQNIKKPHITFYKLIYRADRTEIIFNLST